MKRRTARTAFSTAQLALWDELESIKPGPPAHTETQAAGAQRAPAPRPGMPAPEAPGGAR